MIVGVELSIHHNYLNIGRRAYDKQHTKNIGGILVQPSHSSMHIHHMISCRRIICPIIFQNGVDPDDDHIISFDLMGRWKHSTSGSGGINATH